MKKIVPFVVVLLAILTFFLFKFRQNKLTNPQYDKIQVTIIPSSMKLTSPVFENNQAIPVKYTCQGEKINPPLSFSEIPDNTKSLVLIVDDPDAPAGTFDHWVLYNISPATVEIEENSVPQGALLGLNSAGQEGYYPPCPPSGTHHYRFKLYALDSTLNFETTPNKKEIEQEIQGHILEQIELIGLYSKT